MRRLLLLFAFVSVPVFAGQKYEFKDPKTNDELNNNYKEHKFPNWVYATGSSATITSLRVSTATVSSLRVSTGTFDAFSVAGSTIMGKLYQISFSTSNIRSTTTSNTFQATTLTGVINKAFTSSLIKVCFSGTACATGAANAVFLTIARGGTNLLGSQGFGDCSASTATSDIYCATTLCYLESPAAGALTYQVQIRNNGSGNLVCWGGEGANASQYMFLEEIR
jgi:hypothetical protein